MALILIVLLVSYFNKVKYGKLWGLMGQNVVSLQKSTHFIPMLASPSEPWAPICLDSGSFSEIYNCFQTGYHNLSEAFPIQALFCCGGHSGHIHELYLWKHSLTSEFPEITKHYGPMWWSEVRREHMLRNIKGKKAAFISSYPLDYSHTLIRTEGFFLLLGFGHGV